jgi:hypothetical protein
MTHGEAVRGPRRESDPGSRAPPSQNFVLTPPARFGAPLTAGGKMLKALANVGAWSGSIASNAIQSDTEWEARVARRPAAFCKVSQGMFYDNWATTRSSATQNLWKAKLLA